MNNSEVLGTVFEMSLRILLLLDMANGRLMTTSRIAAYDFMIVYAADFGLSDENLHGNGVFRFSEFAARMDLTKSALKRLVVEGMIDVQAGKHGFAYVINDTGNSFSRRLHSDYAEEYSITARDVIKHYSEVTDDELYAMMQQRIIKSIREVQ